MVCMLFFNKLALCTKVSVLNPSLGIGHKRGQRRAFMRAFALELGARNQHNINLDIESEISLIERIE